MGTVKSKCSALIIFLGLLWPQLVNAQCKDADMIFPEKGDTLLVPCKDMVVLNKNLFLEYHLAALALDSLSVLFPGLEKQLTTTRLLNEQEIAALDKLIAEQDSQINQKEAAIQKLNILLQSGIETNEECIRRLEKSFKYKKQRNILAGTTGALGLSTVVLLLIVL